MAIPKELQHWMEFTPYRKELTPIEGKDLIGPPLHLSTNPRIKEFIPSVTDRTANKEDRSIARVSTAPTILGCLIGYVKAWDDFYCPDSDKQNNLLQMLTIYQFDVEAVIKPSKKLLFDQHMSDELWLVSYSKETHSYQPKTVGRMFYKEALLVARSGRMPFRYATICVEVLSDELLFSKNIKLTKGYWEIKGIEPGFVDSWQHDKSYRIRQISKSDFELPTNRNPKISYEEFTPIFLNW